VSLGQVVDEVLRLDPRAVGLAGALRARGLGNTDAVLAARTGTLVMQATFERWVDNPDQAPFKQIARQALVELRELIT
jgi:hypothetical protein